MSKKSELQYLNKKLHQEMLSMFQHFKSINKHGYDVADANSDVFGGKFDYLLSNQQDAFEAAVEEKALLYKCSNEHLSSYINGANPSQSDFSNIFRCIGVFESINHDLIEQMF